LVDRENADRIFNVIYGMRFRQRWVLSTHNAESTAMMEVEIRIRGERQALTLEEWGRARSITAFPRHRDDDG